MSSIKIYNKLVEKAQKQFSLINEVRYISDGVTIPNDIVTVVVGGPTPSTVKLPVPKATDSQKKRVILLSSASQTTVKLPYGGSVVLTPSNPIAEFLWTGFWTVITSQSSIVSDAFPNQHISPPDLFTGGHTKFSLDMSCDNSTLVWGFPLAGTNSEGYVLIYTRSQGVWTIQTCITVSAINQLFGSSVGLSSNGNILIIGGKGNGTIGRVYVYRRINGIWTEDIILEAEEKDTLFGASVAISGDGNTITYGEPKSIVEGKCGRIYVQQYSEGIWSQTFTYSNIDTNSSIGTTIAINKDGNIIASGDPTTSENKGRIYIYEKRKNKGWVYVSYLTSGLGESDKFFGINIALEGNIIAGSTTNGYPDTIVRIFKRNTQPLGYGNWDVIVNGYHYPDGINSLTLSSDAKILAVGSESGNSNRGLIDIYSGTNFFVKHVTLTQTEYTGTNAIGGSIGFGDGRTLVGGVPTSGSVNGMLNIFV